MARTFGSRAALRTKSITGLKDSKGWWSRISWRGSTRTCLRRRYFAAPQAVPRTKTASLRSGRSIPYRSMNRLNDNGPCTLYSSLGFTSRLERRISNMESGMSAVTFSRTTSPNFRWRTPPRSFPEIFGLKFLDGDLGIAGNMERVRLDNMHAREERFQVGRDHLLQPYEVHIPPKPSLPVCFG